MAISAITTNLATSNPYAGASAGARPAGRAGAATDSQDDTDKAIAQLQRQLERLMQQIKRVEASQATDEQKATQLQALNAQATALQGQIQTLQNQKLQAASTQQGITA
ncbi:Uncharacterised protein [Bordetella ansorpii]|uniref:FlxA-like protein n=1 Tax=Bordetella ansorpii TaxID=288768 RepID=A0A146ATQ8_9BORD|nr:FlxA-like family protein [Bordetella ansorpii]CZZ91954.1 Uncharacterised protein [Bordetella ansorpii]